MSNSRADRFLNTRPCALCGLVFQPYRESNVYCSRKCRDHNPQRKTREREYHARNDVRERKNAARRVDNNPAMKERHLRSNLRRIYGISPAEYRRLLAEQNNRCAICGDQPDPDGIKAAARLHVDHNHVTGNIRALLCGRCNMGIGYFRERPDLLSKATEYIRQHNGGTNERQYISTG